MTKNLLSIPRVHHGLINKELLDSRALKIVDKLQKNGYQAFIVGGGVRDSILGLVPKDFDVSTDATPAQVCKIFSNARIIGRRFKIVHVFFGHEIIEVTTFRHAGSWLRKIAIGKHGIKRDNHYGKDIYEDSMRRDLTINALAFDPRSGAVYDFFNGLDDLRQGKIVLIGDPSRRFAEDPVRILRVIRFSAKLNFPINPALAEQIRGNAHLITQVNSSRLFEEFNKLFVSTHSLETFAILKEFGIHKILLPLIVQWLDNQALWQNKLFALALESTAERLRQEFPVMPAFLFAVFLWPVLQLRLLEDKRRGRLTEHHFNQMAEAILNEQAKVISLMIRDRQRIKGIWYFQITVTQNQSEEVILAQPFWRAGYNLYALRHYAQDPQSRDDVFEKLKSYYQKHARQEARQEIVS